MPLIKDIESAKKAFCAMVDEGGIIILQDDFDDIRKSLEAQIPVTPVCNRLNETVTVGNAVFHRGTKLYECPKCAGWVGLKDMFCKYCGQRLDWN